MPATSDSIARCSEPDISPRGTPALLVFSDDWGRHPSSCQHLVRHLLAHYRVYWVNTIGTRTPSLDLATLGRGFEKIGRWVGPKRKGDVINSNLHVLHPKMWPWFRSRFDRGFNRRLLARQLTGIAKALPRPAIALTTIPIVADLVGVLPIDRWVYYCVDDIAAWPGLDGPALGRMEADLVRRADRVITVSETLRNRFASEGINASLLTHGVDLDHWGRVDVELPADWLDGLETPLVVFWGLIDRRLDCSYLARLAGDLKRGTILLVGPEQDPDPSIRALPRVVRKPALPFELLPALARQAAVLVMPYADRPVTRAIQPLKMREYLATGRPTVVRELPATREWGDCLDLADTPESFSALVRSRFDSGLPEGQKQARGRLTQETWLERAHEFESEILGPEISREEACLG